LGKHWNIILRSWRQFNLNVNKIFESEVVSFSVDCLMSWYVYNSSRLFYVMWLSFNQYNWFFIMWGIIICDKVCQWLVTGLWIFLGTPISVDCLMSWYVYNSSHNCVGNNIVVLLLVLVRICHIMTQRSFKTSVTNRGPHSVSIWFVRRNSFYFSYYSKYMNLLHNHFLQIYVLVHERSITKCDLINNIIKTILPRSIGLFLFF
jgi:hypothetical protein